jgi:Arc/MetJ family transcription regulator
MAAAPAVALDTKKNVVPINLEDEIRLRAYELYQERAGAPGTEKEDWLRAEREVLARYLQTA